MDIPFYDGGQREWTATLDGGVLTVPVGGTAVTVPLDTTTADPGGKVFQGPVTARLATVAYALLAYFKQIEAVYGTRVAIDVDGRRLIALYQEHPKDSGKGYPHPGVTLLEPTRAATVPATQVAPIPPTAPGDGGLTMAALVVGCGLVAAGVYYWAPRFRPTPLMMLQSQGDYLYHETRREHLADIRAEGLRPTSYGQSFVTDDRRVQTPDPDAADLDERAQAALAATHPAADFIPRTYVHLDEPDRLDYGQVLLRFPKSLATPTRRNDVDWYIRQTIPASRIEMLADGLSWSRL